MKKISTLLARQLRKEGKKKCPSCDDVKELKYFGKSKGPSTFGLSAYCIVCMRIKAAARRKKDPQEVKRYYTKHAEKVREYKLLSNFGLSLGTYKNMLLAQDNKCAICKMEQNRQKLSVDHDHITGKVRGLLCATCNTGIGMLKDSPEILLCAYNYLSKKDISI